MPLLRVPLQRKLLLTKSLRANLVPKGPWQNRKFGFLL